MFVLTENAGSSKDGAPYIARWPDKKQNIQTRAVSRPEVLSNYFNAANVIDRHNHLRQHALGLERRWKTRDGFYRFATTIFGMCVTDNFLAVRHAVSENNIHNKMSIKEYADKLCWDIFNSPHDDSCLQIGVVEDLHPRPAPLIEVNKNAAIESIISPLTTSTGQFSYAVDIFARVKREHKIQTTKVLGGNGKPLRRKCSVKGPNCLHKKGSTKTGSVCTHETCMGNTYSAGGDPDCKGTYVCKNCHDQHIIEVILKYHTKI